MQRRFLRARNHDVSKAKAMFMAHVQWRKEFGADTLDQFVFQERDAIISLYPQGYHKTDKMVSSCVSATLSTSALTCFSSCLLSSPAPLVPSTIL